MGEIVKLMMEKKKDERSHSLQSHSYDFSKYKTKFLSSVLEQDELRKIKEEKQKEDLIKMIEDRGAYAKHVRANYMPKINEKRKFDMEPLRNTQTYKEYVVKSARRRSPSESNFSVKASIGATSKQN